MIGIAPNATPAAIKAFVRGSSCRMRSSLIAVPAPIRKITASRDAFENPRHRRVVTHCYPTVREVELTTRFTSSSVSPALPEDGADIPVNTHPFAT